jgi:tetratricopeptide (TPR) repeat protein
VQQPRAPRPASTPRTRLEELLAERLWTVEEFRRIFDRESGEALSERQAYRWLAGDLKTAPYAGARRALEHLFGEPSHVLLGPAHRHDHQPVPGPVVTVTEAAGRARAFLRTLERNDVGAETVDQLVDDVRRLAVAYPQRPLASLLDEIVTTQRSAFELLDGAARPAQSRDLHLAAGIASGLMARASHDIGATRAAMTQARAAFVCADNTGHPGMRSWARALQALIAYWAGDLQRSVRYAEEGMGAAGRAPGTAAVWAAAGLGRSLAALGRVDDARAAIRRADDLRDQAGADEMDDIGGVCTFSRPRQTYYSAEALAWCGPEEAERTERSARNALAAYAEAPADVRSFGDEAGTRCALATALAHRGEWGGATEALAPVLELPPPWRIHGITTAVTRVGWIVERNTADRAAVDLAGAIAVFRAEPLALPR